MPPSKRRPRVNLPYLIRDREYLRTREVSADHTMIELATPLQVYSAIDDGHFFDGPATDTITVMDFDEKTGNPARPQKFIPRGIGRTVSCYEIGYSGLGPESPPEAFETRDFLLISTFATVLKTVEFFQSPDILGRHINWPFPGNKLVVIPHAGEDENAFYDRNSHSLQFYYYKSGKGHTIYTALSHDIVVHETTHAILDAMAPDLYNAILAESLALHEAIADISAIVQTLLNEMVLFSVDALTGGSENERLAALSRIAEEFGSDMRSKEGKNYLRRMKNNFILRAGKIRNKDDVPLKNRDDPHQLSLVLSGILYAVLEKRMSITERSGGDAFAVTLDKTFIPAARRVARIIFRALEYLPPGEVSFIDYGRAFISAAKSTYSKPQKEEAWLKQEYVRRGVINKEAELDCPPVLAGVKSERVDFGELTNNDKAAIDFINQHRELFNIPDDTGFDVLPRITARKSVGKKAQNELFIKVRWEENETHDPDPEISGKWAIRKGTTMVIDLASGKIISLITTESNAGLTSQRKAVLDKLSRQKRLVKMPEGEKNGETNPVGKIAVTERHGNLRMRGSGRLLHIVGR